MNPDEIPALHQLSPDIQVIALAYFEVGRMEGWVAGYAAAEADEDHRWAMFARLVGPISTAIPYDELCERRGEYDEAARHRALLRRRGIA